MSDNHETKRIKAICQRGEWVNCPITVDSYLLIVAMADPLRAGRVLGYLMRLLNGKDAVFCEGGEEAVKTDDVKAVEDDCIRVNDSLEWMLLEGSEKPLRKGFETWTNRQKGAEKSRAKKSFPNV